MNGIEWIGEAIGRMARRPLVICSLLAWIGGVLSKPKVFAALVGFIAAGVWMHGGLPEIHWPQFSWPVVHPSQQEDAGRALRTVTPVLPDDPAVLASLWKRKIGDGVGTFVSFSDGGDHSFVIEMLAFTSAAARTVSME